MKRMGKELPPELQKRFLEAINKPEERLPKKQIVVDEILPPELIEEIDEKLRKFNRM